MEFPLEVIKEMGHALYVAQLVGHKNYTSKNSKADLEPYQCVNDSKTMVKLAEEGLGIIKSHFFLVLQLPLLLNQKTAQITTNSIRPRKRYGYDFLVGIFCECISDSAAGSS